MELKTKKQQLPVIAFNFEEIKENLEQNLTKYQGIVVTDDTLKDCKTTQTELNKLKTQIETYRKDQKKEMEKPIKEFEGKCKELVGLVESVQLPIKEQIKEYDEKKKQEQWEVALSIRENLLKKYELKGKYADMVEMEDRYRNLSISKKEVSDSLEASCMMAESQKETDTEKLETLKTVIENQNQKLKKQLSLEDFQTLIDNSVPFPQVVSEIDKRATTIYDAENPKEEPQEEPQEEKRVEEVQSVPKEGNPPKKHYKVLWEVIGEYEEMKAISEFINSRNVKKTTLSQEEVANG